MRRQFLPLVNVNDQPPASVPRTGPGTLSDRGNFHIEITFKWPQNVDRSWSHMVQSTEYSHVLFRTAIPIILKISAGLFEPMALLLFSARNQISFRCLCSNRTVKNTERLWSVLKWINSIFTSSGGKFRCGPSLQARNWPKVLNSNRQESKVHDLRSTVLNYGHVTATCFTDRGIQAEGYIPITYLLPCRPDVQFSPPLPP